MVVYFLSIIYRRLLICIICIGRLAEIHGTSARRDTQHVGTLRYTGTHCAHNYNQSTSASISSMAVSVVSATMASQAGPEYCRYR